MRLLGAAVAGLLPLVAAAAAPAMPPHLDADGQAEFRAYATAPGHRAFAIAPGGAYGWTAEQGAATAAEAEALARCQANTAQKCVSYSVDGQIVFDAKAWPKAWGPYLNAAQAHKAPVGRELGQRFPDIAYAAGSVSSLRGKVAILHFWAAWCGPCRREMPDLQALYERIKKRPDIVLLPLQVREKFEVSQRWAAEQGIRLPLVDSGSAGSGDAQFRLASGGQVADRTIASVFPTTYVLDRHGVVIFSHTGPVHDWRQYEAFLLDAAARSGK
jgi:thiol-disulfide isomerase/thioredoxin